MSDIVEEPQHTLTYKGKAGPRDGYLVGPDHSGRLWQAIGSLYDPEHDETFVTYERVGATP